MEVVLSNVSANVCCFTKNGTDRTHGLGDYPCPVSILLQLDGSVHNQFPRATATGAASVSGLSAVLNGSITGLTVIQRISFDKSVVIHLCDIFPSWAYKQLRHTSPIMQQALQIIRQPRVAASAMHEMIHQLNTQSRP